MLIDKGEQEHQFGSCQECLKYTNHLWHDTYTDHWFLACTEQCAEKHAASMAKLKEDTWKESK